MRSRGLLAMASRLFLIRGSASPIIGSAGRCGWTPSPFTTSGGSSVARGAGVGPIAWVFASLTCDVGVGNRTISTGGLSKSPGL